MTLLVVPVIFVILGTIIYRSTDSASEHTPLTRVAVVNEAVAFPGDIIKAWGYFIATEIYKNRLVISADASFRYPVYLEPGPDQPRLHSPHYLAYADDLGLIVSEGWGQSISLIGKPADREWQRSHGPPGDKLDAPHGVCASNDGWIYIADSLNSRLVRFRIGDGNEWQVFDDRQKLLGYGRQLLCRDDGVWISNSYEKREGINPGDGGNVVRIADFEAGVVDVVVSFPSTNLTGIEVLDDRYLAVGLWGAHQSFVLVDLEDPERRFVHDRPAGVSGPPYGFLFDREADQLLVTWLGDIHQRTNRGAITIYDYSD